MGKRGRKKGSGLGLEVRTYIRLPKSVYETVDRLAREKGLPVSLYLRMLVFEKLKDMGLLEF